MAIEKSGRSDSLLLLVEYSTNACTIQEAEFHDPSVVIAALANIAAATCNN
jgi:hypothetical protein